MRAGFLLNIALVLGLFACGGSSGESQTGAREDGGPELASTDVALHEVAVLYPLPKSGDEGLIRASRELATPSRSLLPQAIVDKLGDLVAGDPNSATYESLRVVGFRLEPCFRAAGSEVCERQIRFVLQPVSVDPSGAHETTTLDAAVHLIYALPREAFVELVRGIVGARSTASASSTSLDAPLGVHPTLASQGLAGPYAHAIEENVVRAASKGRIARVTFLGARGRGNEWQLGGLEVAEDGIVTSPLAIAGSSSSASSASSPASPAPRVQSIVLQRGSETPIALSFAKSLAPATAGADDVSLLFDSARLEAAPRDAALRALQAANRIENPNLRTSENTDCATCHTVASSRMWAEQKLALRDDRDRFSIAASAHRAFDLSVTAANNKGPASDLAVLRAFGYFGADPIVSTRAINDTARAAAWIGASVSERIASSSTSSVTSSSSSPSTEKNGTGSSP